MLWITFKSCIFAFWNNRPWAPRWMMQVVNYIQILYLCILKQQRIAVLERQNSCELHSNLVSLHSETTPTQSIYLQAGLWITFKSCIFAFWNNELINLFTLIWLWITFKSCIFAFWNNSIGFTSLVGIVVNYIQILYLCILKQHEAQDAVRRYGCELHSNLVSLHSETTSAKMIKYNDSCELHSNLVSLHSETTTPPILDGFEPLWITFKSCIFAFWNNCN